MQKQQPVGGGDSYAPVHLSAPARWAFYDSGALSPGKLKGIIGGTAISDDRLDVDSLLRRQALQQAGQVVCFIEGRDDDG